MIIIPAILVKNQEDYLEQINAIQDSVSLVQLDISDEKFVPYKIWADPKVVKENTHTDLELHLMVSDPLAEMKKWQGLEQIRRIFIHFESTPDLMPALDYADEQGWEKGLAINPDTTLEQIKPYIDNVSSLLFMGVTPGQQGQKFSPEILEKIEQTKNIYPEHFTEIDGGINAETLPLLASSGLDAVCIGSAVFGNDKDPQENLHNLETIINKLTL